ncbi:FtsK/SpoIIIE domain-containing protein [Streptomonospora wellingtoniae]|uniref:FtsK/SpoIIIE domain-containing protein n=1 Tax=Streptomonospora wellingtoniae TaxID=3075544 RepID=A0ABU2KXG2_9ACTN|nr:FtsK/SpoIIIE domain-containing protein [Streptomonospora sp. DSM 45055]MDT0303991.1 FtsK/SpoIIIE domain-containing protein [Streptomonospora sp. DSM 45055]
MDETTPTPNPTSDNAPEAGARVVDLDTRRAERAEDTQPADNSATDVSSGEATGADASGPDDGVLSGTVLRVDPPSAEGGNWLAELAERDRTRRPIVPEWAKSRAEAEATLKWLAAFYARVWAYQATRSPKYVLKLTGRAPRGLARTLSTFTRWVFDWEGEPARVTAVQRNDPETYLKLSRQRDARVRARLIIAVLALVTLLVAGILVATAPTWAQWATLAGLICLLGWLGAPADRPLIDRAVLPTQVQRLDSDIVTRALGALGIAEINKARKGGADGITFPAPITRDGPGWRAEVDLPHGVTVTDVVDRRDRLASGLRRPLGCVWPEPVNEEHPGRLVIWVGDREMSKAKQPAWPLAKTGAADLFKPIPFGHDQRGRLISLLLMFDNVLIGAMPRQGKTFALRVLVLAAALDVLAELRVFELKGTGDLSIAQPVAHRYGSGADDDTIAACVTNLRELHKELERRAKTIASLPKDMCPENKVTPELAAKKSLGLHPLVLAVDECQELFSHDTYGEEAGKLAEAIIKRGPAMGIILILATQRPDAKSLPTGVSANVGIRLCLRVMGQLENDMVLGTSAYKNGIRATTFTAKDKGIGYLLGAADDPQIVRSAYIDAPTAEAIAERARAARQAAGRLTGQAIGQAPEEAPAGPDLLDDLLAVIPAGEAKAWSHVVVDRLAELRPETYGAWAEQENDAKASALSAALKPHGIRTVQVARRVDGRTVNNRGVDRSEVATAVTERDRTRSAG